MRTELVSSVSLLALIFGVWLVANPYYGIWHDSILYTAQALHRLHPEIYANDLFFRFGSQDSFTLFPAIHAWLIASLGIDNAAYVLAALGKLAWFAGLLFFSTAFLRGTAMYVGLAIVVTYSPFFDGHKVFSYGESFVTSRIFSEACVLAALGSMIRGRPAWAAAGITAGVFLHPLMALPGAVAALLLRQWQAGASLAIMVVCVTVTVLSLAAFGIDPFVRLFIGFDPEWFAVISQRNNYIFLDTWDRDIFGRIAFLGAILIAARGRLGHFGRRVATVMLWLAVIVIVGSWLGSSVMNNVLVTQLQLWRGLWLVQITALLLLGGLTPALWNGSSSQRALLAVLWCACLLEGLPAGILAMSGVMGWVLVERFAPDWQPSRGMRGFLVMAGVLLVLFVLVWKVAYFQFLIIMMDVFRDRPAWLVVVSDTLPVVLLTGALIWSGQRLGVWGARTVVLAGTGVLAMGVWAWDGRKSMNPVWVNPAHVAAASSLQSIIPIDATVFWPGGLEATWFWLRRAHYASGLQTAGIVFSRDAAVEARRRQERLWALGFEEGRPDWGGGSSPPAAESKQTMTFSPAVAHQLCLDSALDYLIFPAGTHLAVVARFRGPFGRGEYDLIDCRTLRDSTLPPSSERQQVQLQ